MQDPWDDPAFKTLEIIHAYLHTEGITDKEMLSYIASEIKLYEEAVSAS